MFAVCILHVARMGGFLQLGLHESFEGKMTSNIFEAPTIVAVNVFALLSGYLMIKGVWKIKRLYALILQTVFYMLVFCIIFGRLIFFDYWYVDAYIGLFVMMPLLILSLSHLSKSCYRALLWMLFVVFSLIGAFHGTRLAQNGHTTIWLAVLFAFGGYLKRFPVQCKRIYVFAGWLISVVALFAVLLLENPLYEAKLFRSYTSPLTLVCSLCAFVLLKDIKIRSANFCRFLAWCSPLAFGVYLFHCHSCVWVEVASHLNHFSRLQGYSWWIIPLVSVIIFFTGILIDWIRVKIFSFLHISRFIDLMYSVTPGIVKKIEIEVSRWDRA